jgi:hypothetical protein
MSGVTDSTQPLPSAKSKRRSNVTTTTNSNKRDLRRKYSEIEDQESSDDNERSLEDVNSPSTPTAFRRKRRKSHMEAEDAIMLEQNSALTTTTTTTTVVRESKSSVVVPATASTSSSPVDQPQQASPSTNKIVIFNSPPRSTSKRESTPPPYSDTIDFPKKKQQRQLPFSPVKSRKIISEAPVEAPVTAATNADINITNEEQQQSTEPEISLFSQLSTVLDWITHFFWDNKFSLLIFVILLAVLFAFNDHLPVTNLQLIPSVWKDSSTDKKDPFVTPFGDPLFEELKVSMKAMAEEAANKQLQQFMSSQGEHSLERHVQQVISVTLERLDTRILHLQLDKYASKNELKEMKDKIDLLLLSGNQAENMHLLIQNEVQKYLKDLLAKLQTLGENSATHADLKQKLMDLEERIEAKLKQYNSADVNRDVLQIQKQLQSQIVFIEELGKRIDELSSGTMNTDSIWVEIEKFLSSNFDTKMNTQTLAIYDRIMADVQKKLDLSEQSHKAEVDSLRQDFTRKYDNLKDAINGMIHQYLQKHFTDVTVNVDQRAAHTYNLIDEDLRKLIQHMINQSLDLYSADRINKTDYALKSMGAQIIDHSPVYQWMKIQWRDFPTSVHKYIFNKPNPPETMLDPDTTLGKCWAFKGDAGYAVLRLPQPIIPSSFSIDHVPSSISPDYSSAPRNISVFGYEHERAEAELLVNYEYDINKSAVQNFEVTNPSTVRKTRAFRVFMLRVYSNYGNDEYTCVYRFRIHGERLTNSAGSGSGTEEATTTTMNNH